MKLSLPIVRGCGLPLLGALLTWWLPTTGVACADSPKAAAAPSAAATAALNVKIIADGVVVFAMQLDETRKITPIVDAAVEDITPCLLQDPAQPKYACSDDEIRGKQAPYHSAKVDQPNGIQNSKNGLFELTFPAGTFRAGRLYRLTYQQMAPDPENPGKTAANNTAMNVDTSTTVTLAYLQRAPSHSTPHIYLFQLSSPLGFEEVFPAPTGSNLAAAPPTSCQKVMASPDKTPITLASTKDKDGKSTSLQGWVGTLSPALKTDPNSLNFGQTGVAYVCVDVPSSVTDFIPDPTMAATILKGIDSAVGKVDWTLAPSSKISVTSPTASSTNATASTQAKADAKFYANVNVAAGTGATLAWGIDGKIAEAPWHHNNFSGTLLSATANTGSNTSNIKGSTYSDTIDWMLPFNYFHSYWGPPSWDVLFTVAPDYETDIAFDKRNLLVAVDSKWSISALYQPQSKRTPLKNGALVTYPDKTLNRFGYVLQFHGGLEAGGALVNTVQKATSGAAKITVPTYSIARAVPQIRGLLQWIPARPLGLLTFDDTIAGRYLFDTENTVQQFTIPATSTAPSSVGLRLRPISGWKAYNSLTGTWYPPQNSHVGITAAYNDGFNAPKFTRVNSVLIGVTIIY